MGRNGRGSSTVRRSRGGAALALLAGLIWTALTVAVSGTAAFAQISRPGDLGGIRQIACPFFVPPDDPVLCGLAGLPDGASLAFALFPALGEARDTPLVIVPGGPGDAAFADDAAAEWFDILAPWRRNRAVLVYDPRGAGLSPPSLACPEVDPVIRRHRSPAAENLADGLAEARDAAIRCFERLRGQAVQPERLTTGLLAQDLATLKRVLEIESAILLGFSHGARVALHTAETAPATVTALILDSPDRPSPRGPTAGAGAAMAAFNRLTALCAAREGCPDPGVSLAAILARAPHDALFLASVVDALARGDLTLPDRLAAVAADPGPGDPRIAPASLRLATPWTAEALLLSVRCADGWSRLSGLPPQPTLFQPAEPLLSRQAWCARLGLRDQPAAAPPAAPRQPTLILAGGLDPLTPLEWSRDLRDGSPQSILLARPTVGHGVLAASPCARDAVTRFLDGASASAVRAACQ